jgi:hypothetical protein
MRDATLELCDHSRHALGWNHERVRRGNNVTLAPGHGIDLHTGAVVPGAGGDFFWDTIGSGQYALRPHRGAELVRLPGGSFDALSHHTLPRQPFSPISLKAGPGIPNAIGPDTIIGIRTATGHHAKLKVIAANRLLKLDWVTFQT